MNECASTSQNHISQSPPRLLSPLGKLSAMLLVSALSFFSDPEMTAKAVPNASPSKNKLGSFCDQMKLPFRTKRARIPVSAASCDKASVKVLWNVAKEEGRQVMTVPVLSTPTVPDILTVKEPDPKGASTVTKQVGGLILAGAT